MDRLRFILIAALLAALASTHPAFAQTPAAVSIVSGNGQVTCLDCFFAKNQRFQPMVVKVMDAKGKTIPNTTVNWNLTAYTGPQGSLVSGPTTQTDKNGITSNAYFQYPEAGSPLRPFLQSTIVATAGDASATFTETEGLLFPNTLIRYIGAMLVSPPEGSTLAGTAGAPGNANIHVHVDAFGAPVPNVSVRLLRGVNGPATISCATGPGADPGSVLTDANGDAWCTPAFGSISGAGSFTALAGGVDYNHTTSGYWQSSPPTTFSVTSDGAARLTVSGGNSQSANPGEILSQPLLAKATDWTGAKPVAGAQVTWTVSPPGAATLSNTKTVCDANGLVSSDAMISSATTSSAPIESLTVKVAIADNPNISATFTIALKAIPAAPVAGFKRVSGDQQKAVVNASFGDPLVVQMTDNSGQAVENYPVQFSVTTGLFAAGVGSVSAQTVNTDSTGRAQVMAKAGATPGTITVTAAAGSFLQTFTLTVTPVGPGVTADSLYNGASLQRGWIAPCSIATIIAPGLAPGLQGVVAAPSLSGPLPYTLANDKVIFNDIPAPIISVSNVNGQEQVTVQAPCELGPGSNVPVTVNVWGGATTVNMMVLRLGPGIFETVMSDGVKRALATRPDGSTVSLENPAQRGEILRVYLTGMGPVTPAVGTNSTPLPGTDSMVLGQVSAKIGDTAVRVLQSRLSPNLVGVYEVPIQVDANSVTGNNVALSVAVNPAEGGPAQFSSVSNLPVQ